MMHALLLDRIRACRLCVEAGYPIAPGPVLSSAPHAHVMVMGQAPGITEAEVKRPFNAGSGRRLFAWLAQAGFDEATFRAHQHMTAVTKCYPGRASTGRGDRVPSPAEQGLCRPWLEAELALIQPRLIIPVGRLAIGVFRPGHWTLEEVIGTQWESAGRVIIPLPHPSGASAWPHLPGNATRLAQAIDLLRVQWHILQG